jgi:hypothetical protein
MTLHVPAPAAIDFPKHLREIREQQYPRFSAAEMQRRRGSEVIETAGFTTNDDILHGFGGGYLPPIVGSRSRPAGPFPEIRFAARMTVVIQPNVTTRDGKAGADRRAGADYRNGY